MTVSLSSWQVICFDYIAFVDRALRIQHPGSCYCVTCSGNGQKDFLDTKVQRVFICPWEIFFTPILFVHIFIDKARMFNVPQQSKRLLLKGRL